MNREEFEQLVTAALDGLPEKFAKELDNVEVVVEDWPSPDDLQSVNADPNVTLFGLYRGVAKTKRDNYAGVLPDKISIFMGPIITLTDGNPDLIKAQVKKTVLHEIGHHLGMDDEAIRRAQRKI